VLPPPLFPAPLYSPFIIMFVIIFLQQQSDDGNIFPIYYHVRDHILAAAVG
jgi:hypothetical protein